jgi:hypothetical protein
VDIYLISGAMNSPGENGDFAYIGLTKRPAETRIKEHLRDLRNGEHSNPIIQGYYNQYGRDGIVTGVIVSAPQYYLNSLEKYYIDRFTTYTGDNPKGWNRSLGGEGAPNVNRPFALRKNGQTHYGTDLCLFLMQHPDAEAQRIIELLEGRIAEWNGWTCAA